MTLILSIGVGVVIALGVIGGVLWTSMWFADRKMDADAEGWKDNGSGNSDGYGNGNGIYHSDAGCGGGGGD